MSREFAWKDDDQAFRAMQARVRQLRRLTVTAGVHGDTGVHPGTTFRMPELAAVHEFGDMAERIPERSFIRAGVDKLTGDQDAMERLEEGIEKVVLGEWQPRQAATLAGVLAEGAIRDTIEAGIEPELADLTKKMRDAKAEHGGGLGANEGRYTPLHDSGQLLQSITHKVGTDDGEGR